jgi:hypothetical protein
MAFQFRLDQTVKYSCVCDQKVAVCRSIHHTLLVAKAICAKVCKIFTFVVMRVMKTIDTKNSLTLN